MRARPIEPGPTTTTKSINVAAARLRAGRIVPRYSFRIPRAAGRSPRTTQVSFGHTESVMT